MYGDAAKAENDWAFDYLPKVDRNYSWTNIWDNMYRGKIKGMLAFGMNGVAIGPDSQKNIEALKKADFLVVGEIYPDETSEFWSSPGISKDDDEEDQHHGLSPALRRLRREGTALDDQLLALAAVEERRPAAVPGWRASIRTSSRRSSSRCGSCYKKEVRQVPRPHTQPRWPYTDPKHPSLTEIAKEINGKALVDLEDPATKQQIKAGQQLPGFTWLKDDGTHRLRQLALLRLLHRAGNQMARRGTRDPSGQGIHQGWAWSWAGQPPRCSTTAPRAIPRASRGTRSGGRSGGARATRKWVGNDVPDFKVDLPALGSHGAVHHEPGKASRASSRRSAAFADGPFPEHYEPIESVVNNPFHPNQSSNPVVKKLTTDKDVYAKPGDEFNIVCNDLPADRATTTTGPRTIRLNVQLIPSRSSRCRSSWPSRWASRAATR